MVKKIWRKRQREPILIGENVYELLEAMGGSQERSRLAQLWANWPLVLGEELAAIASPLGSRGRTLLIRAEDSMQMQELHFLCGTLLEKVNAFLGSEYFVAARLTMLGNGKICLSEDIAMPSQPGPDILKKEALSGKFLAMMDRKSPVALCYARFVRNGK